MKLTRIISIILAGLILTAVVSSCGPAENTDTTTTTADPADTTTTAATTKANPLDAIPVEDFKEYEFKALVINENGRWDSVDFRAVEDTGEPINDAVYMRNTLIEDRYNIKIKNIDDTNGNVVAKTRTTVSAGDNAYDIVMPRMASIAPLTTEGALLNLFNITTLDLSEPYWDQREVSDLSIDKQLYIAAGDLMTLHHDSTNVCVFNKNLIKEFQLEDPYKLVNENKWTIDKLNEMIQGVTKDLNGDTVFDRFDMFGFMSEKPAALALTASCGQRLTSKDKDDMPVVSLSATNSASVVQKVIGMITNKSTTIIADYLKIANTTVNSGGNVWTEASYMFAEGKILFRTTSLRPIRDLREFQMQDDFGMIPLPKWNEAQSTYYHVVQSGNSSCVAIPKSAPDAERTGLILQAICAASTDTLRKAYYDINLVNKVVRDEDSAKMLDIIFSTRYYDLGVMYNWGSLGSILSNCVDTPDQFVSLMDKNIDAINTAMAKTVELYGKLAD